MTTRSRRELDLGQETICGDKIVASALLLDGLA